MLLFEVTSKGKLLRSIAIMIMARISIKIINPFFILITDECQTNGPVFSGSVKFNKKY